MEGGLGSDGPPILTPFSAVLPCERHGALGLAGTGERGACDWVEGPGFSLVAWTGWGTCGKGRSPSASFLQLTSGPNQEKVPPLTLLKLGNQVQPGGAGEEWAGPEGGGPIGRGREQGRVVRLGLWSPEARRERAGRTEGGRQAPERQCPLPDAPSPLGLGQGPAILRHGSCDKTFNTEPGADRLTSLTPDLSLQEPGGQTALKSPPGVCSRDPTPAQTRRLAQAMMAFTADLFSLVAQTSTCPNLILSPLSVALALSHLALGTLAPLVQTKRAGRPVGTQYSVILRGGSSTRVTWLFGKNADS